MVLGTACQPPKVATLIGQSAPPVSVIKPADPFAGLQPQHNVTRLDESLVEYGIAGKDGKLRVIDLSIDTHNPQKGIQISIPADYPLGETSEDEGICLYLNAPISFKSLRHPFWLGKMVGVHEPIDFHLMPAGHNYGLPDAGTYVVAFRPDEKAGNKIAINTRITLVAVDPKTGEGDVFKQPAAKVSLQGSA